MWNDWGNDPLGCPGRVNFLTAQNATIAASCATTRGSWMQRDVATELNDVAIASISVASTVT